MYSITEDQMTATALTPAAKLVLACIHQHIQSEPTWNLPYATIAKRTAMSDPAVIRAVKLLIETGFIQSWKDDQNRRYYK